MRFAIITYGSRGDIQPYVPLARGLQRAGHEVRFVTTIDHAQLVADHGVEVWSVEMDIQAALREAEATAAIEGGKLFASFRQIARIARRGAELLTERSLQACRGVDTIIVGITSLFIGLSIAEKLELKLIQAYNVPLTPTSAFPGALLPNLSIWPKGLCHRLSHKITRQIVWSTARAAGNRTRKDSLGLPSAPLVWPFDDTDSSYGPILYGISPSVIGKPADWGDHIEVTGYWFLDPQETWSPPRDLVEFLDAGPPPVYLGFGSMSSRKPAEVAELAMTALHETGQRAILLSGWGGLSTTDYPETVFVVDSIPHSWLFERVAAVVHHGGAGTTAAAFRAGIPSVVVPFHGDQPFWARRVVELGVGPKPIPRNRLTARRLAEAMEEAVTDRAMLSRADALGAAIRAEDGIARAIEIIEKLGV